MQIGILGAGRMGGQLGRLWARCGHEIRFAYARSLDTLTALARETGGATGTVAEVVAQSDVLLLAVHWSRVPDVLAQAGDLAGKVVLNCCVPLDETDTTLVLGPTTSGAEELARLRPAAHWVGCFNTSPSECLASVFACKGQEDPPQLLVYGADAGALEIAQTLIRDIGFAPCPAGGLRSARFVEPFAMITAELAYEQPGGPALTYRFEKLRP
ncbi:NADPH-dependent F420 reductase [Rhodobacter lacus]|uniref:NADPH-dependent F420 reductase n=1 Tax=Rhodobacter lacus TaxID=1641972 RepID=A0ABW5ADZ7_9RHOB